MNKSNHNTSSCRNLGYNNPSKKKVTPECSDFPSHNKNPIFTPKNNSEILNDCMQTKLTRHSSEQELFFPKRQKQKVNNNQKSFQDDLKCYEILEPQQYKPKDKPYFLSKKSKLKDTTSTASQKSLFKIETNSESQKCIAYKKSPRALERKYTNGFENIRSIDDFSILKRLGQGKFGKVYLVKNNTTNLIMAMKVIQKQKVLETGMLTQFIRELKIQMYLNHPNIVKIFGFFDDRKNFYILLELGCDGQLFNFMTKNKIKSQESTAFICKNLLQAITYMHGERIIHRDIKPQNIVLIHGCVKLCDFGWSVNKKTKQELRTTFCGTPLYLSPELLTGSMYDQKVDIWAIGVLTFELLLESSPFQIQSQQQLHRIVTSDILYPPNKYVSRDFKEFMSAILRKNPNERLKGDQLAKMKFISRYNGIQTCDQLCQ